MYSEASDNGPSEKRTTSLQQTSVILRIGFILHNFSPYATSEKRMLLTSGQRTKVQLPM